MIRRTDLRLGSRAGLFGGLLMVITMLAARLAIGAPALPDILADAVTWLVPIEVIAGLIDKLKYGAKPLFFVDLVLAQLVAAVAFGIVYQVFGGRKSLPRALVYAIGLWLLTMVILLPIVGAGFFGAGLPAGQGGLILSSLASFVAYGFGLAVASQSLNAGPYVDAPASDRERRAFIGRGVFGGLLVITGGLGWLALPRPAPAVGAADAGGDRGSLGLTSAKAAAAPPTLEVTPTADFYVVSKNFVDPVVEREGWKLEIGGLVERPFSLTYDELIKLPAHEQYATLTCISNEVGGDLIGNALWKGVSLADLLARAGVKSGVRDVVLRAADDYEDSIPIDRALMAGTMVAFQMNGKELTDKHGFPARLVVPGIYGMKNVKWLKQIELVDHDFQGFWEQRGWSDEAIIHTMSRIDAPLDRAELPSRKLELGGIAFAGDRGISKVEVSTDGGKTWQAALLKEPLSPYTWVLWKLPWQPPKAGVHRLLVRAYDGAGNRQIAVVRDPLPDGATGLHTIKVNLHDEG